ncbi:MAG: hypothetical protein QOG69_2307 [Actinomycetota bacterium]|nr:hypothetical protein [Actinomycetota bacterium]
MFRPGRTAVFAAVAVLVALALVVSAEPAPAATPRVQRLRINLGTVTATRTVLPSALPTPSAGDQIGPGSHLLMTMDGDANTYGCTANFVWASGSQQYLGAAGHCFLPADKTATAGPGADYNPSKTHVKVCVSGCSFGGQTGFIITGTLVDLGPVAYARQTLNGADVGNDFGLVTIPASLSSRVNPTMPVWGGPQGTSTITTGSPLCLYGNAAGLGEMFATKARAGVGVLSDASMWEGDIASFEGDSGSAVDVCGATGVPQAAGILTHLVIGAGVIAGTTVSRARAMATEAGLSITIVSG